MDTSRIGLSGSTPECPLSVQRWLFDDLAHLVVVATANPSATSGFSVWRITTSAEGTSCPALSLVMHRCFYQSCMAVTHLPCDGESSRKIQQLAARMMLWGACPLSFRLRRRMG
jgi:hypothetical protein